MRPILSLVFIVVLSGIVCSQIKKPEPPPVKVPFDRSLQAVVVTTNGWDSVAGTAQLFERKTVKGEWKQAGESFPVVVGRSGLAWGETQTVLATRPRSNKRATATRRPGCSP